MSTTATAVLAARPSYAQAAEHLPDGLVVAREDGCVVLVNSAVTAVTGIERSALIGRDVRAALPFSDTTGRDWWHL
ncbi:PAS domain-containing protein, partial [Escherichia coli]|nr:PAS domain-containing protein [Escherichia coli]